MHTLLPSQNEQSSVEMNLFKRKVKGLKKTGDSTSHEETFIEYSKRPIPVTPQPGLNERKDKEKATIIIGGCALAFNSGWVNAITISHIKGLPSTHVTGHFTMVAIDLIEGRYYMCGHRVLLILCFLFGAMMTGMIIPYSSFHLGRNYSRALLLEAFFLLIALIIEQTSPGNLLFYLGCAISSGIQNAITTRYSGNILRTTHHTGTTTDIGIFLGRMIMGNFQDSWKLYVLTPLPICYVLGGLGGVKEYHRTGHLALLFNVLFILFVASSYGIYMYLNIYLAYQHTKEEKKKVFHSSSMGEENFNPMNGDTSSSSSMHMPVQRKNSIKRQNSGGSAKGDAGKSRNRSRSRSRSMSRSDSVSLQIDEEKGGGEGIAWTDSNNIISNSSQPIISKYGGGREVSNPIGLHAADNAV